MENKTFKKKFMNYSNIWQNLDSKKIKDWYNILYYLKNVI